MSLFMIKNEPGQERYGELVFTDNSGHTVFDIVYDGKGYHNYPSRVDGDYRTACSELHTYGEKALFEFLGHLKQYYSMSVRGRSERDAK